MFMYSAMDAMGDKINSKRIAKEAGCYVIPGFEGTLDAFTSDVTAMTTTSSLANTDPVVTMAVPTSGTNKEVQTIAVSLSAGTVATDAMATLAFGSETTSAFSIYPAGGTSCTSSTTEVQRVSTTTSGGDNEVDMYTQFRLRYGSEVTAWINANSLSFSQNNSLGVALKLDVSFFVASPSFTYTSKAT